jgi:hypothetical protein
MYMIFQSAGTGSWQQIGFTNMPLRYALQGVVPNQALVRLPRVVNGTLPSPNDSRHFRVIDGRTVTVSRRPSEQNASPHLSKTEG